MSDIYEKFAAAQFDYRGKPFWSWNGKLDEKELIRQVHVLKEMGFGGFFMHSRTGLVTEYLSDEWFELINACADEAEKLGMEPWLYDEDRWPSGTAGGMVTEIPEYRSKYMRLTIADSVDWSGNLLAAFSCRIENKLDCYDYARIYPETDPSLYAGRQILLFTWEEEGRSTFFNGNTYADTMSIEATEYFIKLTYDKYKEKCGNRMGRTIKGIFTDEPHRGYLMNGTADDPRDSAWTAPWTYRLFEKFEEAFGYDLADRLPEIFLKPEGRAVSQVKWHYVEILQRLFIDNFAKPLNDWCIDSGIEFTGHFLHENQLNMQVLPCGSVMRMYEHMGYPGVDVLHERTAMYWIVKQLSSAARQLGKKWMLSELYGCTGWQLPFEAHKTVGDWQAFFGINLRCHHLSWYTMAGVSKRDYPASILHQSGWWKDYGIVETYFARLSHVVSTGEECSRVLVMNPVESVWCMVHAGWAVTMQAKDEEIKKAESMYAALFGWLQNHQIDFDYADEEMAGRLYSIHKDNEGAAVLRIGRADYRAAIVSGMTTIRSTTLKLLAEFAYAGGSVIFAGDAPGYVDALESDAARDFTEKSIRVPFESADLVGKLEELGERPVRINSTEVLCRVNDDGDIKYMILLNMNRKDAQKNLEVRIKGHYAVEKWICATGERFGVPGAVQVADGDTLIRTSLPRGGEAVYVLRNPAAAGPSLPAQIRPKAGATYAIAGEHEYSLSEPNVCPLDMARCRVNGGDWGPEKDILAIDNELRSAYGIQIRSGEMLQPWVALRNTYPTVAQIELAYDFYVDVIPEDGITLVMETPENNTVSFNGEVIDFIPDGEFWIDICFRKMRLPKCLIKPGLNTVGLKTDLNYWTNNEAVYLLGDFGVALNKGDKVLTSLPGRLVEGDICGQGLPFYSGVVTYRFDLPKKADWAGDIIMNFRDFGAALLKVHSPGFEPVSVAWAPLEADVTEMADANGFVYVDAVLTRKNTFGPLHRFPVQGGGTGFSTYYSLFPSGLLNETYVDYCDK